MRNIAWAAGLFEGEGTIGCWKSGGKHCVATLRMTDEDVVRAFHGVMGIGSVTGPLSKGPHKPYWSWQVQNKAGIKKLIDMFRPYMGTRRLAKMAEVYPKVSTPDLRLKETWEPKFL